MIRPATGEWLNNATQQVTTALAWLDKNADEIPSHVNPNPGDNLKARAKELITQAQIIDSSTFTENLQNLSGAAAGSPSWKKHQAAF